MPSTPLTDAIQALTTYANTVTGASDTTLSDAVESLADGYGGGGIDIGVTNTPIVNILNMFYELEHGTAKTGTITPTQAFPNTETEVFDTGLTTVHGLFIADASQETNNTSNTPENMLFAFVANPTNTGSGDYALTRNTIGMAYATNTTGVTRGFLTRCSWRVDSGKLYITCDYNRNDQYTPFHSGHTYRWVAW